MQASDSKVVNRYGICMKGPCPTAGVEQEYQFTAIMSASLGGLPAAIRGDEEGVREPCKLFSSQQTRSKTKGRRQGVVLIV